MSPFGATRRFPWCMSAWKNPSRSAWDRNSWIMREASAPVSWPAARMAPTSAMGVPWTQSLVMTRRDDSGQCGCGTVNPASFLTLSANSDADAASSRRSSSPITTDSKCATTSRGRSRRLAGDSPSIRLAARWNASISRRNAASIPGRRTLTATSAPSSARRAWWTCAIDAAASGSEKLVNSASTGWPSSARIMRRAMAVGKGGRLSCRTRSCSAIPTPTTSGRVDRIWPNLT